MAAENGQPEPKPETRSETKPAVATIHVPSADLGAGGDNTAAAEGEQPPKKKRTRRGSRGGRNRRKKPAGAATEPKPESASD